jgi:MYXO-CTERM domain-containing protein
LILNTNGATLSYNLMGSPVTVPDSFTWTVTFSGANIGSGGTAGVPIFTPPTSGGNYLDYWENDGTFASPIWILKTNASVNVDFAARVSGVPEPSIAAFAALGAAGLLFRLRRKN